MDKLTTLDGLGNITGIGESVGAISIVLTNNLKLTSATALSQSGTFASSTLIVKGNPLLACVPQQWPAKDSRGDTIRHSTCNDTQLALI